MKRIPFILLCFFTLSAFAQKDSLKEHTPKDSIYTAFISVSAGIAIPVGVYGYHNTTINNQAPSVNGTSDYAGAGGFAQQGSGFTITAIASLKRPGTSFMGQLGLYQNKFDVTDYAAYQTASNNDFYTTTNQLSSTSNSSYKIISLMGGMYMPVYGLKVILGIRMMGGAVLCISPDVAYSGQSTLVRVNNTINVSDHVAPATAISWAVTAAIDARYIVSHNLSIILSGGFFFCLPKFDATETDINGNSSTIRIVSPTSLVNINVGIGYRI